MRIFSHFYTIIRLKILILSFFLYAPAVHSDTIKTIGISVWTGYPDNVRGFKDALAKAGFIEGKNVKFLMAKSGPDRDKQRSLMEEFRAQNVDMVYSLTTQGTVIAEEVLPKETPIVFSIVTYPADSGLIESFEYSGNNLVGTSNYVPIRHYVNLLQKMMPESKKVAIFHRKGEPNSKIQAANLIRLFKKKKIESVDVEVIDIADIRRQAIKLSHEVDAFVTTTDTLMQSGGEKALIEISLDKKIPILSSNKSGIQAGSTFGPVVDFYTLGTMSGRMAVSILRDGVKPSHIESRLQEPPITLINKKSANIIELAIKEDLMDLLFVDEN